MERLADFLDRFSANEAGSTMVEYTLLIGLITIVVVALIAAVGNWVRNGWTAINSTIANYPLPT